jgi:hypothetical protein
MNVHIYVASAINQAMTVMHLMSKNFALYYKYGVSVRIWGFKMPNCYFFNRFVGN